MTDTEVTAEKAEATPEQKAQRHAVRVLARAMSKLDGTGTPEERKARWSEGKSKFTTDARKLVKAMTRDGVVIQLDPTATKTKRGGKKAKQAETADSED